MNQAIQSVADKYGIAPCPPQEFVHIGIPALDAITGGVPKGRIVDIHGAEDAGKTALALAMAKGSVLYIDAENKLAPCMVKGRKDFYVAHVQTLEAALEVCRVAAKGFDTIILDTLEALPLEWDPWEFIAKPNEGPREGLLSRAFSVLVPELLSYGCTLIIVNQMRAVPGVFRYEQDHSTGGRALNYYAALRLDVRCIESVKTGSERTGQRVRVRAVKNKYGSPGGAVTLTLDYLAGFGGRKKR